jgi:hypothetical protein
MFVEGKRRRIEPCLHIDEKKTKQKNHCCGMQPGKAEEGWDEMVTGRGTRQDRWPTCRFGVLGWAHANKRKPTDFFF